MDPGSDEYNSELEAEVDDIMYRVFGDECGQVGDDDTHDSDSCGSNNDLDDQSSEEEMEIDSANS